MRVWISVALLGASCALKPLPAPRVQPCDAHTASQLWTCVGTPDPDSHESAFASTMRVVYGDLSQRSRNQHARSACTTAPPPGFELVTLPGSAETEAPLNAFFARGSSELPIVIVVHGLFDSKANRYVEIVANALAAEGFGVLVPDMRWHGCLLSREWLATLTLLESHDLLEWRRTLSEMGPERPVGLIGFSMGGLDVISAIADRSGAGAFEAGAIAISPPADLPAVVARLDARPSLWRERRAVLFHLAFRSFLGTRLREIGLTPGPAPFATYLHYAAGHWPGPGALSSGEEILVRAEPTLDRLAFVRRPLLIITSDRDPVLGGAPAAALRQSAQAHPWIHVITTRDGGHVGQLGRYPQWIADSLSIFFRAARGVASAD